MEIFFEEETSPLFLKTSRLTKIFSPSLSWVPTSLRKTGPAITNSPLWMNFPSWISTVLILSGVPQITASFTSLSLGRILCHAEIFNVSQSIVEPPENDFAFSKTELAEAVVNIGVLIFSSPLV
jgi:hypothetical protein